MAEAVGKISSSSSSRRRYVCSDDDGGGGADEDLQSSISKTRNSPHSAFSFTGQ